MSSPATVSFFINGTAADQTATFLPSKPYAQTIERDLTIGSSPTATPAPVPTPTPRPAPFTAQQLQEATDFYTKLKSEYPALGAPEVIEYSNNYHLAEARIQAANTLWGPSAYSQSTSGGGTGLDADFYSAVLRDAISKLHLGANLIDISSFPSTDFPSPIDQGIGKANFKGFLIMGTALYQVTNIQKNTTGTYQVTFQQVPLN